MKYLELQQAIDQSLFTILDVKKKFPKEKELSLRTQLSRFVQKGLLVKIKRGLYCFIPSSIDEFELANKLYQPSYVSLETALNYYGVIPDISQGITSVSLTTTKKISNKFGVFYYAKIKPTLFWGWLKVKLVGSDGFFLMAQKEKALLDFFYLRRVKYKGDLRLNLDNFNFRRYQKYVKNFPRWVQTIKLQ